MNTKNLIGLLAVAVIVVAAAYWASSGQRSSRPAATAADRLVPELAASVNEVTKVTLVKAGDTPIATLNRGEAGWSVAEKHGYPANIRKIRELLLGLADAKLVEKKTAKADLYNRLGVQDLSEEGAPGVMVTLDGLTEPAAIIVGDIDSRGAHTYARHADEVQTWLVSGAIRPDKETRDWLATEILDISADRIQRVTIRHPDGETLDVVKESRDQASFIVLDIPVGRELKSEGVANNLASALSSLGLEDVALVTEMNPAEREGPTVEYRTFDGLVIAGKAFEADGAYLVHFGVSADEAQALRFAESGEEETAEAASDADSPATDTAEPAPAETESEPKTPTEPAEAAAEPDFDTISKEAEALNGRLEPWVFTITSFKHENMTQRMEDLLAPAEDKEAEAEKPDVPPVSEIPEIPPETGTEPLPTSPPPASAPMSTDEREVNE